MASDLQRTPGVRPRPFRRLCGCSFSRAMIIATSSVAHRAAPGAPPRRRGWPRNRPSAPPANAFRHCPAGEDELAAAARRRPGLSFAGSRATSAGLTALRRPSPPEAGSASVSPAAGGRGTECRRSRARASPAAAVSVVRRSRPPRSRSTPCSSWPRPRSEVARRAGRAIWCRTSPSPCASRRRGALQGAGRAPARRGARRRALRREAVDLGLRDAFVVARPPRRAAVTGRADPAGRERTGCAGCSSTIRNGGRLRPFTWLRPASAPAPWRRDAGGPLAPPGGPRRPSSWPAGAAGRAGAGACAAGGERSVRAGRVDQVWVSDLLVPERAPSALVGPAGYAASVRGAPAGFRPGPMIRRLAPSGRSGARPASMQAWPVLSAIGNACDRADLAAAPAAGSGGSDPAARSAAASDLERILAEHGRRPRTPATAMPIASNEIRLGAGCRDRSRRRSGRARGADRARGAVATSFRTPGSAGPFFAADDCRLLGGRIGGGTSLGPVCRVRGEVEASVFLGFSNKAHDGFVGHSYLGEWVNLGALTTTSDLKNNYSPIGLEREGVRERDDAAQARGLPRRPRQDPHRVPPHLRYHRRGGGEPGRGAGRAGPVGARFHAGEPDRERWSTRSRSSSGRPRSSTGAAACPGRPEEERVLRDVHAATAAARAAAGVARRDAAGGRPDPGRDGIRFEQAACWRRRTDARASS